MCSFCGKSHAEVLRLIAGPSVYICDGCINVCNGILDRELGKDANRRLGDIRRTVNHYLIGRYRACLEWFHAHVLDKAPFRRRAHTQQEEERPPSPATLIFASNKKYRFEISLGLYQCLVSNATIAEQMRRLGFISIKVCGVGRRRTAEASWPLDDATITITSIKGKIETKSEYPLVALLEGIGRAEEIHPPKEIPSKGSSRNTNATQRR
jgi:ATP-dependent protease Clp, ATPase subunit